ncbi:cytochrome P450 98A3 [Coprinopsis sp. MPI-PUGE-AT-0042]|nr:cytochrome P450 98A3 [Coprinopsis sp. MPI-PUGE-AT-0042]
MLAFVVNSALDRRKRNPLNLPPPPGPPKVPFFGNKFQMSKPGPLWETYTEWAREYGDMFYLTSPGENVLVLNSLPAITELLERRSSKYSDRTVLPAIEMAKADWNFGLFPYGSWWRAHRRAFHQQMNQQAVPHYRPIIQLHMTKFLRSLSRAPEKGLDYTHTLFGEIIMHLAYGIKDEQYIKNLTELAEAQIQGLTKAIVPGRFLVNTLPFLRHVPDWCPGTGWKKFVKHLADMNEEMTREGTQDEYPSMVGHLLERLPSDGPEARGEELVAQNVTTVAYVGGADTTIGTASGLILALAMHPDVQRRAQEEIDTTIGPYRLPDFDDYERLPYLQALVKEVVRMWPVAPLAVPHAASEDDVYNDYFIPRGTIVMPNSWAIFRDPAIYPDPYEFRPERFLKDGKINPDILDPNACAFGFGRRYVQPLLSCSSLTKHFLPTESVQGRWLSQESLSLYSASLLALFTVSPAKDAAGSPIPLKYEPDGTMVM